MRLNISISGENAAFVGYGEREYARILRVIADKLDNGRTGGRCIDANGNVCGGWALEEEGGAI